MVPQLSYEFICLGGASAGWTHGVQFVCLAFQNSMASQIGGCTLHHWSGNPVSETDGTALTKDAHKLATKRQSVRWALIDEVSFRAARGSPGQFDRQGSLEARQLETASRY